MDQKNLCSSVFKNGKTTKEEYTAVWISLVNQLIKDQRVLAREEKRT